MPPFADLHHTTQDESSHWQGLLPTACSYLFVLLHGDHPALGGARYRLEDVDLVTIGRGEAGKATRTIVGQGNNEQRHLTLTLPGNIISANHARLRRESNRWILEDAGSRNGTRVNGQRIERCELSDGDLIEIGHVILRLRKQLPGPPGGAKDMVATGEGDAHVMGLTTLLPALQASLDALVRVASSPVSVLLLGETGTGKEVLARAVHTISGRRGAFVAVNCGGLASSLLESQLFGHRKGAFTGAERDELGLVRAADRGTLFLDEIGDLPPPAQAAILRVLQEREVMPVGQSRPVQVDLRVVAATHRPLDEMAGRGEFRSDLLARLAGYRHELIPLRERREDLGLLLGTLCHRTDVLGGTGLRINPAAALKLVQYDWPLNIRELHQGLASASALVGGSGAIGPEHLPSPVRGALPLRPTVIDAPREPEALRELLVELLTRHQGNVSHVARELGKARFQIHRWMQRFGLDPGGFRK